MNNTELVELVKQLRELGATKISIGEVQLEFIQPQSVRSVSLPSLPSKVDTKPTTTAEDKRNLLKSALGLDNE